MLNAILCFLPRAPKWWKHPVKYCNHWINLNIKLKLTVMAIKMRFFIHQGCHFRNLKLTTGRERRVWSTVNIIIHSQLSDGGNISSTTSGIQISSELGEKNLFALHNCRKLAIWKVEHTITLSFYSIYFLLFTPQLTKCCSSQVIKALTAYGTISRLQILITFFLFS